MPSHYISEISRILAGKRIWVLIWSIFIWTPDMAFLVAGHHNCIPSFSIFYFDKSLELLEYLWPKEINKCYGVVGLVI